MKKTIVVIAALIALVALACLGAQQSKNARAPAQEPAALVAGGGSPAVSREAASRVALDGDYTVGSGKTFDNLTVFPVLAKTQADLGPFTTLDDALELKTAEVRETGADGQSGTVNQLVVENKGRLPIYVLAGTVVKGGRQDRQIGQDFVVGANQTVPVDAFCVEHGRWTAQRDGVATNGKFGTMRVLANSEVRAAGQYQNDQGQVWSKVSDVNRANKKSAASDTLTASLDDKEMLETRARLAGDIHSFFKGLEPQKEIVGLAYAVDGKVRGVRWFANQQLFLLYRSTLINTASVEAITARAAQGSAQRPAVAAVGPDAVRSFIAEITAAKVTQERATAGDNVNAYKESVHAYASETMFKDDAPSAPAATAPAPGAPRAAPVAKPRSISSDFVSK